MADDAVLSALGGGGWRSGAEIAAALGVSRAAVWKSVERLRERGYGIESAAGRGYRLVQASDRLLPAEIRRHYEPARLAPEIVHRDVVDSTNRLAAELARKGAAEGTAVVAEQQSAGRGRLGRSWVSPAGVNLYLSVVLRPVLPPTEVPRLTLVAAVALAEAVGDTVDLPPEIKWPNDLLIGGRKVAGILTELEAEADRVRFVVLGIGVNLNARAADFPPELRRKASSLLLASGRRVDRAAFAGRLLTRLDRAYDRLMTRGFAALRPDYERFHVLPGRRVVVEGNPRVEGVVLGIDDDGALRIETAEGVVRVVAGEVTLRGTYRGRSESGT